MEIIVDDSVLLTTDIGRTSSPIWNYVQFVFFDALLPLTFRVMQKSSEKEVVLIGTLTFDVFPFINNHTFEISGKFPIFHTFSGFCGTIQLEITFSSGNLTYANICYSPNPVLFKVFQEDKIVKVGNGFLEELCNFTLNVGVEVDPAWDFSKKTKNPESPNEKRQSLMYNLTYKYF